MKFEICGWNIFKKFLNQIKRYHYLYKKKTHKKGKNNLLYKTCQKQNQPYVVCSKSIVNFDFPRVKYIRYSIFDFLVALCWYSYPSLKPTSSVILNVQLIFDSYFAWTYFCSSSIFAHSKKMDQRICVKISGWNGQ